MRPPELRHSLAQIVGDRNLVLDAKHLGEYARSVPLIDSDRPSLITMRPQLVVRPANTSEVVRVVRLANDNSIPVYLSSGGTEVSGGALPVSGGILVDMTRMSKILVINREACTATVQAACKLSDLERNLESRNLRLGHIPLSLELGVTAAGAASTYGIGAECSGYDTLADHVIGMEVVLSSGEILRLKPTLKSSMSHRNLCWLFLGTEGAFGVITELTLRVRPFDHKRREYMMVGFPSFSQAVRASYELYRKGVAATMTFAMNRERALWAIPRLVQSTNVRGLLVLAFDGPNKELVSAQKRFATKMLAGKKAKFLDHRMMNEFRKNMFGGIASTRTGLFTGQIGAATPSFLDCRSALRWYRDSERICSEYSVSILGAAHLGPRHGFISIAHGTRGSSSEDNLRNIRCRYALIKRALELGGTAESSHGIGVKNVLFLRDDLGPIGVRLLRALKRVLDPKDILNPGKAWDGTM